MDLLIRQLRWEADDIVSVTLADPHGDELPSWEPGAHLDLHTPVGVRQYSLCGDPRRRDEWRVAVRRAPQSRGGSQWIHDEARVGGLITVGPPRNSFPLVAAPSYLFIGGGIGLTPLLPMIGQVARAGLPWTLLYAGRRRTTMAFLDELAAYGDRVHVRPADEHGRLDVAAELAGVATDAAVYCCGPAGLITTVEQHCQDRPTGSLHVERFEPVAAGAAGDTAFDVELDRSGVTLHVPADASILDVIERAGIAAIGSCYQGTCGSCETRVLDGRPDHRDSVLSESERIAGETMMLCVSRATSRLVLDL
ncbi:ferredoxin (plasmid) [Rhodococcus pyridinivorans SB3094]|uniref:Ferredoxin n=1 Tax=Rhodococcus pyridinivorans SB3094 TaxID=1435356 RepID=V9XNQ7_9NOCA|nr:ferredoxin [Rhodococcus pyridinivorans SB3094]